jgi:hypothetical protein
MGELKVNKNTEITQCTRDMFKKCSRCGIRVLEEQERWVE